ncbi:MAG TPA: ABC transporter ATP-binding protein [Anaerolineae bacterium]|nr:ABC transporter ATP-binding protein [Caldilineae bacterium]HID34950.1 ABC transporter ATP-binding protein [Anaerolineae bacterium]
MTPRPAIRVQGLAKTYPGRPPVQALHPIHFQVDAGELTVVLGPNGAGKTTLFKILATLLRPDDGEAWVAGAPLWEDRAVRARIGVITDPDRSFFWRLDGRENLRFFAAGHGIRGRAFQRRLDELVAALGMAEFIHRRVGGLSSGQRGRLALARALFHRPDILLLDEPTRSLDPSAAGDFMRLLEDYLADQPQASALLSTHRLGAAAPFTRRVLILHQGRLLADGPPDVLIAQAGLPQPETRTAALVQLYAHFTGRETVYGR